MIPVWMQTAYWRNYLRPRKGVYRRWQRKSPELEREIALAYERAVAKWKEDFACVR